MRPTIKFKKPRKPNESRGPLTIGVLKILAASKHGAGYHEIMERLVAFDIYPDEAVMHSMINQYLSKGWITADEHYQCPTCFKHMKHYHITAEGRMKVHDAHIDVSGSLIAEIDTEPGVDK